MSGVFASLDIVDAASLSARLDMGAAVGALRRVLRDGFDPADDLGRTIVDVATGQLLLMPGRVGPLVGHKLVTVAPGNPERGLPRIQGLYVLLDPETLAPTALIDGAALTSLRTPAVSAAIADLVASPRASRLVVFGTGPQGVRHVEAMRAIRPIDHVRFIGRDPGRAGDAVAAARADGLDVAVGSDADVAHADIVVCATTARTPFASVDTVPDDAVVIAIGSHEPAVRELPGPLVGRSHVIVETREVAASEAGDVIMAAEDGLLDPTRVITFRDLFARAVPTPDRPRIVKTCGMGWQDLVVAHAAMASTAARS